MTEVVRQNGWKYPALDDGNTGYEEALGELGRRFSERGLALSARRESEAFDRKVAEGSDPSSLGARIGDVLSSSGGVDYRSGRDETMTNEDALRLFYDVSGRAVIDCRADADSMREAYLRYAESHPVRPASIYSIEEVGENGEAAGALIAGEANQPAAVMTTMRDERRRYLQGAVSEWLPQDRIGRARSVRSFTGATAAISLIVILALTLMLPVILTVLINRTAREISADERELRTLEKTEERLAVELEDKNDLRLIEKIATEEYGMIRMDLGNACMLRLNYADAIECFDPEPRSGDAAFLALLSALGIRAGNE